jgi:hypothetical protein
LGLAYDTHIRAILTRMDLEHQIISLWSSEKYNPHEAWSASGTKCLKRLIALIRLCGPRLVSLLSGSSSSQQSHSFLATRPSMTASEALTILLKQNEATLSQHGSLENQMIASNTQIRFSKKELLLLVKNYLLEEGLVKTAEMLAEESNSGNTVSTSSLVSPVPSTPISPRKSAISSKKRNHEDLTTKEHPSPDHGTVTRRKMDPFALPKRIHHLSSGKKFSTAYHAPSTFGNIPLPPSGKSFTHKISNEFKTPNKHGVTTPHRRGRGSSVDRKHLGEDSNNNGTVSTNGITLGGIINSYLRHQHQQCQHPVSIVPNFSLFEKHRCPAPPTPSNSLCDVLFQRRLYGDNINRNKSYSFLDINRVDRSRILKHRIFSEYRQWRIFQESQYDRISCAAFSGDSRKVWIGGSSPHNDGMERDGSLRLFDISTSQELGQWDFDQSIDSIITPTNSESQILMTTTGHGAIVDYSPTVSYRTNIWRTNSQSQHVTDYFLDPVALVEWEDLCRPVFNSLNTMVCGIQTQQPHYNQEANVLLNDVETGSSLLTFNKSLTTSQSTMITVPYKVPNATFGLGSGGDNIVLADGILWDCRTGGIINDFDRLSHYGHGVFHPNGNCLLIDNVVWDMRRYGLLQTVKHLEGGYKTHFSTDDNGSVLFGYNSRTLEHLVNEEYLMNPLNQPHNCFYTMDSSDYSLIHTFELDSDGTSFWGPIQSDPVGLGYMLTCEVRFDHVRRSMYDVMRESCCRVLEIGRRKPGMQDSDMDDAQTIDDDDWDGEDDLVDEGEDDDLFDDNESDGAGDFQLPGDEMEVLDSDDDGDEEVEEEGESNGDSEEESEEDQDEEGDEESEEGGGDDGSH